MLTIYVRLSDDEDQVGQEDLVLLQLLQGGFGFLYRLGCACEGLLE